MALPNVEKTWQVDLNIPFGGEGRDQDCADGLLLFVLAMTGQRANILSNVWTVAGSSDASTAGFPGPGWQTRSDITFRYPATSGSGRSWIVLQRANGGDQLLIDCLSNVADSTTTGRIITIKYSPSGGYSGGSTTSAPTATDAVTLNAGTGSAYWLGGYNGAGNYCLHIRHSTDGKHTYAVWCYRGFAVNLWLFSDLEDAPSGWDLPYVAGMSPASSVADEASFANFYTAQNIKGRVTGGGGAINVSIITESWDSDLAGVTLNVANAFDGSYLMTACGAGSDSAGAEGMLGRMPDIWLGTSTQATGYGYPSDESIQFAAFGDFILPWDGSPMGVG